MASEDAQDQPKPSTWRFILLGKTGVGKSATGNTILRKRVFESRISPCTVTSKCQMDTANFEGQMLRVVDTPWPLDACQTNNKIGLDECMSYTAPGPHAFIVVIQPNRFTEQDRNTVKILQQKFGEDSWHYTMVLFTHGDNLETDEVSIEEVVDQNSDLRAFIHQCGGGYHVFNNRSEDPSQVRELLEKINTMVAKNGGRYYTNEMFRQHQRAQAQIEKLGTENPNEARGQAERNKDCQHSNLDILTFSLASVFVAVIITVIWTRP